MLHLLRYTLPFFISFPSYLAYYSSLYALQSCSEIATFTNFVWGFNVANFFIGAPLLAGIFIDYIGVVITQPIFDILFIIGELIVYCNIRNTFNEATVLIGLFFIYFAYGLKETCRVVYMANTFIRKDKKGYNLLAFTIQTSLATISLFGIFILNSIAYPGNDCVTNVQNGCLLCLILSIIGFCTSLGLYKLNQLQISQQRPSIIPSSVPLIENGPFGNIFLVYNNRLDQDEDATPTLVAVLKTIFRDKSLSHIKYWLLTAGFIKTLAILLIQRPLVESKPYIGFIIQAVLTIPLVLATTEKRCRFFILAACLLSVVYQIYSFFDTTYVQWILTISLPILVFLTDIYTPILLDFDLRYLGTVIGIKNWLENLVFLGASIVQPYIVGKDYYKFSIAILGTASMFMLNWIYLKNKGWPRRSSVAPLADRTQKNAPQDSSSDFLGSPEHFEG